MSHDTTDTEHEMSSEVRLFDCLARTHMGFKNHDETQYRFLNRSAWEIVADIRKTLDSWLSRLPPEKIKDISARFRGDDRQHHGALLELVIHEILSAVGTDLEVEPDFFGKAPDFAATLNGGTVLVECTVTQEADKEFNATRRKGVVKEIVDSIETRNYFLDWEEPKVGNRSLPARLLRKRLETWIASLDPNEQTQPHSFLWCHEGWKFRFQASRGRPDELVGTGSRAIGTQIRVEAVGDDFQLSKSLEKKAKKYRTVNSPYLIVVGAGTWFSHEQAILHALFGRSIFREPKSFLGTPSRPKNCHVSAVLYKPLNPHASVWGLCHPKMPWELVHNPWSSIPLQRGMFEFATEWVADSEKLVNIEPTRTLNDVLGLPNPWPRQRS